MGFVNKISKIFMITHYKQDTPTKVTTTLRYIFALAVVAWIVVATIYMIA